MPNIILNKSSCIMNSKFAIIYNAEWITYFPWDTNITSSYIYRWIHLKIFLKTFVQLRTSHEPCTKVGKNHTHKVLPHIYIWGEKMTVSTLNLLLFALNSILFSLNLFFSHFPGISWVPRNVLVSTLCDPILHYNYILPSPPLILIAEWCTLSNSTLWPFL